MSKAPPIGVFDSGVGGLTVVRALRQALPGADIIYLGDTARVPYGSKSARTVERYALSCTRFLLDHEVSAVLIACNTASATALAAVREHSPVPVVGAVDPGADSALAATTNGHIGVIGTLATVRSHAYVHAIAARRADATVTALACPLLVPLAEEGWTDGDIADAVCQRYLGELFARDPAIDTLVLGCTHYPLLREAIAAATRRLTRQPVHIVDSASAMAQATYALIGDATGTGSLRCYVTDATRLDELASRFLGHDIHGFDQVDL